MAKKKIIIETMTEQEVDNLSAEIGSKVATILGKPMEQISKYLKTYGLEMEFGYNIKAKQLTAISPETQGEIHG
jgi:hypothetical protein